MKQNGDGTAAKIDVILGGMETIGSAERSTNVDEMQDMFHTISDGEYAQLLYDLFGKDRVEKELDEFLDSLNTQQFTLIRNFFDTMPVLKHTVKYKCETCGEKKETTVQGLNSFFG